MTTISRTKAATAKKLSETKITKATKDADNNNINNSIVTKNKSNSKNNINKNTFAKII